MRTGVPQIGGHHLEMWTNKPVDFHWSGEITLDCRMRVVGTSGGDDHVFVGRTRAQTHLMSFKYNGSVRSGNVDGLFQQMTDTGTIPNNPNADFVIGGCGRDYGTPTSAAKSADFRIVDLQRRPTRH